MPRISIRWNVSASASLLVDNRFQRFRANRVSSIRVSNVDDLTAGNETERLSVAIVATLALGRVLRYRTVRALMQRPAASDSRTICPLALNSV